MKIIDKGGEETLLVPDDYLGGKIANVDEMGWVTIGDLGYTSIVVENTVWADFVKFINEIDAYRKTWPVKEE